jgi:hypothetical protein
VQVLPPVLVVRVVATHLHNHALPHQFSLQLDERLRQKKPESNQMEMRLDLKRARDAPGADPMKGGVWAAAAAAEQLEGTAICQHRYISFKA